MSASTLQATSGAIKSAKPKDFPSPPNELNAKMNFCRIVSETVFQSDFTIALDIPVYSVEMPTPMAGEDDKSNPAFRVEAQLDKNVYYDRGDIKRKKKRMQ